MKSEIQRILAEQTNNISFEEENGKTLVDLDCYAITGFAAEEIADLARKNHYTSVFTIQSVADPCLRIILIAL